MDVEPSPDLTESLLAWYDRNARALPWRQPPGSRNPPDPWAVLLAEVMLQQTTVATVASRWGGFLERWPTVGALAAASEADVLAAWAGLGYYARARNLHAAARIIAGDGWPPTQEGLRRLPGLGAYAAASVAAIAFARPVVVVDANIARMASRLFALDKPWPESRALLAQALAPLVPADRPGDFAQAGMDLGALVCTPRAPRCSACPLQRWCRAHAAGATADYPRRTPRRARASLSGTAWWIEAAGAVALVRRPSGGLLGGMLSLPGSPWLPDARPVLPPVDAPARFLPAPVDHRFTHRDLCLAVAVVRLQRRPDPARHGWEWHAIADLPQLGLPTLYRRVVDRVLADPGQRLQAAA